MITWTKKENDRYTKWQATTEDTLSNFYIRELHADKGTFTVFKLDDFGADFYATFDDISKARFYVKHLVLAELKEAQSISN